MQSDDDSDSANGNDLDDGKAESKDKVSCDHLSCNQIRPICRQAPNAAQVSKPSVARNKIGEFIESQQMKGVKNAPCWLVSCFLSPSNLLVTAYCLHFRMALSCVS